MNFRNNNTSLIISCSLSLLLIGLFMYIDKGKTDRDTEYISDLLRPAFIPDSKDCSTSNAWTGGSSISSKELDRFFDNDSMVIEPDLYQKIDNISYCIQDKDLKIKTARLQNSENDSSVLFMINKYHALQAAFQEKGITPREIQLTIPLTVQDTL
jgi:hypothetical protein